LNQAIGEMCVAGASQRQVGQVMKTLVGEQPSTFTVSRFFYLLKAKFAQWKSRLLSLIGWNKTDRLPCLDKHLGRLGAFQFLKRLLAPDGQILRCSGGSAGTRWAPPRAVAKLALKLKYTRRFEMIDSCRLLGYNNDQSQPNTAPLWVGVRR
jgi:hypothetical protein